MFTMLAMLVLPPSPLSSAELAPVVNRSIALMQRSLAEYPKHETCFSCHHQGVPSFALSQAKQHGYSVDEKTMAAVVQHTRNDLKSALEAYKKGDGQPGAVTRAGYAMLALQSGNASGDEVTDAVAQYLLLRDRDQDHWRHNSNRPPEEASSFTDTFLAARALKAWCDAGQRQSVNARLERATAWLQREQPKDTEDEVFRIWALKECGADEQTVKMAAARLLSEQQPDGGWAQIAGAKSDAYATGSALTVLNLAGRVAPSSESYQRGARYLVQSQEPDGSWHVVSRSKPFQPYFETGFPHGKDQFISMAATAWATAALALATPAAHSKPETRG